MCQGKKASGLLLPFQLAIGILPRPLSNGASSLYVPFGWRHASRVAVREVLLLVSNVETQQGLRGQCVLPGPTNWRWPKQGKLVLVSASGDLTQKRLLLSSLPESPLAA